MTDEELAFRLRRLPRRTVPIDWRRSILAQAEALELETAGPRGWHLLMQPWRLGWVAVAAAWVVILLLRDSAPTETGGRPMEPAQIRAQLLSRARDLDEFTPRPTPARPTSSLAPRRRSEAI